MDFWNAIGQKSCIFMFNMFNIVPKRVRRIYFLLIRELLMFWARLISMLDNTVYRII